MGINFYLLVTFLTTQPAIYVTVAYHVMMGLH